MQKQTIEVARRDKPGNKEFVPWQGLTQHVVDKLDQIQVLPWRRNEGTTNRTACHDIAYLLD